ncbi:hypothetical protein HK100_003004 [Physocladia obscura]|uniref:FAD-binding domain-containing protein n=1 Tax=Physocladia obscura TaxID=109957 RepID=A0AAD5XAP1_9FUNG|nr:hypothetical protein HK100_003004 [Physocladia obscura]
MILHYGVVDIHVNNIKLDQTCGFFIDRINKRMVCTFKVSEKFAAIQVGTFGEPDPEEGEGYCPYSDLPKHSARLADLIAQWQLPPHVVEIMRKSFRISPFSVYDLPDLETYYKGRVVLLEDSAHGMLPNAGLGLGAGLEDVGVLAELMKRFPDYKDLSTVLRLYSAIRVPTATGYSQISRMSAEQYYATTFGATGNHFLMRLFIGSMNIGLYVPIKEVYDCPTIVARAIEQEKVDQSQIKQIIEIRFGADLVESAVIDFKEEWQN